MAHTVKIIQGSTTLNIHDYSKSADTGTYFVHSVAVSQPPPEIIGHQPDFGEARVIRTRPTDRLANVQLTVHGSTSDDILNGIAKIRRMCEQAFRYEMDGDVDQVYLELQMSGSTNATKQIMRGGWVDDSGAIFEPETEVFGRTIIRAVNFHALLQPGGELASITIENYLASSPHFLEDSDADGLADGWNAVGTPSSTSINTTNWLIGGQSQIVTTDADSEGIESDSVTTTGSDDKLVLFVWLYVTAGTVTVVLRDATAGSDASTKTASLANADDTATDSNGNTWWKISISSTGHTAGNSFRLRVRGTNGSSFSVDGAYFEVGTSTVPAAGWISARNTENRYDIAQGEADYNYYDVWGIPGDLPAYAIWKLTSPGDVIGFRMGRMVDGVHLAADQVHWVEDDEYDARASSGTGSWSDVTTSGTSDDRYVRFTEGVTTNGGTIDWNFTGDAARQLAATPRKVWALVKSTAITHEYQLSVLMDSTNFLPDTEVVNPAVAASWTLIDLGTLNITNNVLPETVPDTTNPTLILRITIGNMDNTDTADIDALFLPPILDDYMIMNIVEGTAIAGGGSADVWINGQDKTVVSEDAGFNRADWMGSMWYLTPGQVMNRVVFMTHNNPTNYTFDMADGFTAKLTFVPRSRHQIGTL